MSSWLKKLRFEAVSGTWRRFLAFYACFTVFTCFSNTFINTYLLRGTGSNEGVMIFNIVLAIVQPFAMVVSVLLMHKKNPLFAQRIGIALYAIVFLALTILGEAGVKYILLVSAMLSAANGFFFTTYAMQVLAYTQDENRDANYGLQTVLGNVIGLVLPTLSGLLVTAFGGFLGYRVLFMIGLAVSVLAIVFSTRLTPVNVLSPKSELRYTLRVILKTKSMRAAMLASTANGFYDGTMLFFMNLLIFNTVDSEALIGFSGTVASISAILASAFYARFLRRDWRARSIIFSVGFSMLMTLTLLITKSAMMLLIVNAVVNGMHVLFVTPSLTAYFGVTEANPNLQGLGGEVHTLREFWYAAGRVLGVLITLMCLNVKNGEVAAILAILALQMVPAILMRYMNVQDAQNKK